MIRVAIRCVGTVEVHDPTGLRPPSDEEMDCIVELIMDELVGLNVEEPYVSAVGRTGELEIGIAATGEDFLEAQVVGNGTVRAAIHAAGGHTRDCDWAVRWDGANSEPAPIEDPKVQPKPLVV